LTSAIQLPFKIKVESPTNRYPVRADAAIVLDSLRNLRSMFAPVVFSSPVAKAMTRTCDRDQPYALIASPEGIEQRTKSSTVRSAYVF